MTPALNIIGIAGRKREGKDSVCSMIREFRPDAMRVALADPIKQISQRVWGLTPEQTDGDLKETLDTQWDKTPRQILQFLGTEVARSIHPDTWVRLLVRDCIAHERRKVEWDSEAFRPTLWVVPDVRFLNEARVLREHGAVIWRVQRFEAPSSDTHPSEMEVDQIEPDVVLDNRTPWADGGEAILRAQVQAAYAKVST